jgi:hypothetical protein
VTYTVSIDLPGGFGPDLGSPEAYLIDESELTYPLDFEPSIEVELDDDSPGVNL